MNVGWSLNWKPSRIIFILFGLVQGPTKRRALGCEKYLAGPGALPEVSPAVPRAFGIVRLLMHFSGTVGLDGALLMCAHFSWNGALFMKARQERGASRHSALGSL